MTSLTGDETSAMQTQHHLNQDAVVRSDQCSSVVQLRGVTRQFGTTLALNNVSMTVNKGEIVGIIGRSGAGKSTLIRCLNGLEQADSGTIEIEGQTINGLTEKQLQKVRSRVGMVFQHFNLLAAKTVAQNIALPLKIAGYSKTERIARVRELLSLVGLSEKENHYPAALSGGQKQRVGIARALAANPALLLCDEATSALDPETTRSILSLLKTLNQRLGITILLITHEMEVIRNLAHRVAVIDQGKIIEHGYVWQVFAHPQQVLTRSMLYELLPQLPESIASRLSPEKQGEAIYNIHFAGEESQTDLLTRFVAAFPSKFRLLQGGVDHIQHYVVIRFFIALNIENIVWEQKILAWLKQENAQVELLGYVANDD